MGIYTATKYIIMCGTNKFVSLEYYETYALFFTWNSVPCTLTSAQPVFLGSCIVGIVLITTPVLALLNLCIIIHNITETMPILWLSLIPPY